MLEMPVQNKSLRELERLTNRRKAVWEHLLATNALLTTVQRGEVTKKLYAIYMLQTYHYTLHNSRNQALVGVRAIEENGQYLKYCFEHASEEVGHEQMAIKDVVSLGISREHLEIPDPLPETEIFIAYVYWISATGNPVRRLGYSFWAESAYDFVNPLIEKAREMLGLKKSQMTFLVSHAMIDEDHAKDVMEMLRKVCRTEKDWEDVERVMETTLSLAGNMFEAIYREHQQLVEGKPSPYSYLNRLL